MVRVSDKDEAQNISTDSLLSWSGAAALGEREEKEEGTPPDPTRVRAGHSLVRNDAATTTNNLRSDEKNARG